jgi:hypothetical protein
MKSASQFDALNTREGYTLSLELDLYAAAQLPRHFVLSGRSGPHLQPDRGRGAVEALHAKNPWSIHQRL